VLSKSLVHLDSKIECEGEGLEGLLAAQGRARDQARGRRGFEHMVGQGGRLFLTDGRKRPQEPVELGRNRIGCIALRGQGRGHRLAGGAALHTGSAPFGPRNREGMPDEM
jgi:hypothetical protein